MLKTGEATRPSSWDPAVSWLPPVSAAFGRPHRHLGLEVIMKGFFRRSLIALPLVLGLAVVACDDDDDDITSPGAPLVPSATETPAPSATMTPTPSGSMTPTPSSTPGAGEQEGFLGRIQSIDGNGMRLSGGVDVFADAATQFFRNDAPASINDFSVGEMVRVSGVRQSNGTVVASKISLVTS
jgi:hypothetical protein